MLAIFLLAVFFIAFGLSSENSQTGKVVTGDVITEGGDCFPGAIACADSDICCPDEICVIFVTDDADSISSQCESRDGTANPGTGGSGDVGSVELFSYQGEFATGYVSGLGEEISAMTTYVGNGLARVNVLGYRETPNMRVGEFQSVGGIMVEMLKVGTYSSTFSLIAESQFSSVPSCKYFGRFYAPDYVLYGNTCGIISGKFVSSYAAAAEKDSLNGDSKLKTGCIDTDGGRNYRVKGNTYILTSTYATSPLIDHCILNNEALTEYYCASVSEYDLPGDSSQILSEQVDCQNGCFSGACI